MEDEEKKPGNYLVFDGGLSGLPGLYTLEELLSRLRFDLKSKDELLPWRYFKVIIGSGPGGMIAIFVGRMKMTASAAVEAYSKLLPVLSVPPAKDEEERRINTEAFKSVLLEILKEAGYDETTPFVDENEPKTIICTLNTTNPSVAHLIRSYQSRSAQSSACTILEAACACVASPDTFLPVTVGTGHRQVTLIDATTGFANSSQELLREAQRVFGGDEEVATLVSIGAGKGDVWSLSEGGGEKEKLQALQQITMNCEPVHEELWARLRETGVYYRLNVERRNGSHIPLSSAHILAHLQEGEISDKLDNAIKSVQGRIEGVKLKDINSVAVLEIRLKPRPSLAQNFVGREDVLQAMHQTHIRNRSAGLHAPAITVLSGLGGSGKTQIALRFALDYEELYPDTPVYFLNAESEESLATDYETLIRSQGAEHRSKSHHDALVWLATNIKNWLIILDNADNPTLRLFSYLPKCTFGNVIITTRNSNHASLAPNSNHHIGGLSESDSVSLILESSGYERTEANQVLATEIVRELGSLPLALAQAAGYISVHKRLSSYLAIYRKSTAKILASSPLQRLDDYPSSVARTIEMSMDRLPPEAKDVMRLLAHLDSTSIPHMILAKAAERQFEYVTRTERAEFGPETLEQANTLREIFYKDREWSEFEFDELVNHCLQYSLLQITTHAGDQFYSMHVLLRSYLKVTSTWIQGQRPGQLIVRLLGSSITIGERYEFLPFNRLLLPHIRIVQLEDVVEAGDHYSFGRVLDETGDTRLALAHQERCVEMWRASLGEEHQTNLSALTNVALYYKALGRIQEAVEVEERILALDRKRLGEEHPNTMIAMHNLADSYRKLGRKEEAMEMEEQVLKLRQKILGPEDSFTLRTMNNLAVTYMQLGRTQDALKLWEQVLEMRRKVLGPEHPNTLGSMQNLANSYGEVGREAEALKLGEQVVELRTRILGLEHPDTLDAMWNLSCSLKVPGLEERRSDLLRIAVPAYEKAFGVDHPNTKKVTSALKKLLSELSQPANIVSS